MVFWTLILFAVSFIATALLTPKPKFENARAASFGDVKVPQASEGSPIPLTLGLDRLFAPNTLWYGNFRTVPIIEEGPRRYGFIGPKAKITVGFRYYLSMDLGLCLGPEIHLRKVWMDKDQIWAGDVGPNETAISVDLPSLFGGDKSGGGFSGTMRFYGGGFSQPANAFITALIGGIYPAYMGQAHIVLEDCYIGTSPSLRPVSFEVQNYTNNLGLTTLQQIIGLDLNCAEVLYTALTTKWGSLGLETSTLDITSFQQGAIVLAAEGNGMSLTVAKANSGKDVATECLRQMDGILYQDPQTSHIMLRLIRRDYDPLLLPVFGPSEIAAVRGFSRSSWQDTINQVRVQYPSRDKKYESGSAMEQDMANINMQGRLRSTNLSFPGVHDPNLAQALATREIAQLSVPLYSVALEINRKGGSLRPGDPFVFNWPEYGLSQVIMRVGKFNLGALIDGRVVIDAIQDEFATDLSVFAAPETSTWIPIDRSAINISVAAVIEAPYFIVANRFSTRLPLDTEGFFYNLARIPGANQATFSTQITQPAAFSGFVQGLNGRVYSKVATLVGALAAETGFATGTVGSIVVNNVSGVSTLEVLTSATNAQVRTGYNLFYMNGEFFTYETATAGGGGSWTLTNVRRALMDTRNLSHVSGSTIFFIDALEYLVQGSLSALATAPLSVKFQAATDKNVIDWTTAFTVALTPEQRYARPLPADFLKINGFRTTLTVPTATPVPVTWARRAKVLTGIATENDADQVPDVGTTYDITFYLDGVLQGAYTQTGLTGTSASFNFTSGTIGYGELRITTNFGGLASRTYNSVFFKLGAPGYSAPVGWLTVV